MPVLKMSAHWMRGILLFGDSIYKVALYGCQQRQTRASSNWFVFNHNKKGVRNTKVLNTYLRFRLPKIIDIV